MKITSKGRVAVTSLVDMAINCKNDEPIKLSDISKRQKISIDFLEQVFYLLKKKGIVKSSRGPLGGYMFAISPDLIMIADVIDAINEDMKITKCNGDFGCNSAHNKNSKCLTHNLWNEFRKHILYFLESVSIEEVSINSIFEKKMNVLSGIDSKDQMNA
ncbi:MAG: Rrf2 family transcriptional regulator [Pseudomonadota bacterium]|nr:Rrf2 family transcriptional regulator [Pseudomonadota bacterium]